MAAGRPDSSLKQGDHIQLTLGQIKEVGSRKQLESPASPLPPSVPAAISASALPLSQPLHPL